MVEAHSISSPTISNCKLSKIGVDLFQNPTLYKFIVGALQYATLTRLDINFVVNKVCQFMAKPLDSHWVNIKRILRYLKCILSHGLHKKPTVVGKPLSFTALCDANWALDIDDKKSTFGSTIFLGPNLIS
uniref:Retrovirus-related Pol polyprotein from transposon TNT 1-94 n=1 Tax=Cajanus cajan TaxID=3821 RepID=A0A151T963_CAJCA|nr:hypothetical protein KK1_018145 [Cajanus cajan]